MQGWLRHVLINGKLINQACFENENIKGNFFTSFEWNQKLKVMSIVNCKEKNEIKFYDHDGW